VPHACSLSTTIHIIGKVQVKYLQRLCHTTQGSCSRPKEKEKEQEKEGHGRLQWRKDLDDVRWVAYTSDTAWVEKSHVI
jgi:hypothetical protein